MADIDLKELIAAPIMAINNAELSNAEKFVEILDELAFEVDDNSDDKNRKLRNLKFTFDVINADGSKGKQQIDMPLIQFMPISGVSIESVILNYSLHLDSKLDTKSTAENSKAKFTGRLAEQRDNEGGLSGNLDIQINLKQIDLPMGVLNLLQASQTAVSQISVNDEVSALEPELKPDVIIPDKVPKEFVNVNEFKNHPEGLEVGQHYVSEVKFLREEIIQENELIVVLSCEPKNTLKFEQEKIELYKNNEFKAEFIVTERVKSLSERTIVKLVLTFILESEGIELKQEIKINLK